MTSFLLVLLLIIFFGLSLAKKCENTDEEAVIIQNDIPSAKAEAIGRAKWSAVEKIVGVEVKVESILQNMALVDAITKRQTYFLKYSLANLQNSV